MTFAKYKLDIAATAKNIDDELKACSQSTKLVLLKELENLQGSTAFSESCAVMFLKSYVDFLLNQGVAEEIDPMIDLLKDLTNSLEDHQPL